ncbi:MAG: Holliday junction branch migration protein RuvA [Gemmatimonadetes bacterium]|nr:Holliday junction branch migration protein RuvA [Gemmatimonadota bacterium]
MIAGLAGTLTSRDGDRVTIATAGGVIYEVSVPTRVLEQLPRPGQRVELQTVPIIREDGWSLYGFDSEREKTVFQKLMAASGVGPRLALAIISSLGGDRVILAIRDNEIGLLCSVKGVGKKTAEKLIVELRDRIKGLQVESPEVARGDVAGQATKALMNLGYSAIEADRAIRAAISRQPVDDAGELVKESLKELR